VVRNVDSEVQKRRERCVCCIWTFPGAGLKRELGWSTSVECFFSVTPELIGFGLTVSWPQRPRKNLRRRKDGKPGNSSGIVRSVVPRLSFIRETDYPPLVFSVLSQRKSKMGPRICQKGFFARYEDGITTDGELTKEVSLNPRGMSRWG
jgi:hypothetical protein